MIKMKEILVPWYLIFAESFCPIRSSLLKLIRVIQSKSSFFNKQNFCAKKNVKNLQNNFVKFYDGIARKYLQHIQEYIRFKVLTKHWILLHTIVHR